jgi:hypothetical protein
MAAEMHNRDSVRGGFRVKVAMLTLTYRPDAEYSPRQVTELQDCITDYLRHRGHQFRGVWVLELTKAGRPHYHLLLWLPRGVTLPKPDSRGWWPHGMTKIEWARNAVGYLVKYASKAKDEWQSGATFPAGARLFGIRGLGQARPEYTHAMRPFWMRERVALGDRVIRCRGGGFVNVSTGEAFLSPWVIVARDPGWRWVEFELRGPPTASAEGGAQIGSG